MPNNPQVHIPRPQVRVSATTPHKYGTLPNLQATTIQQPSPFQLANALYAIMEVPHPAGTLRICKYYVLLTTANLNVSEYDKRRAAGCICCTVVSTFLGQKAVAKANSKTWATWIPGAEFRLKISNYYRGCNSWALYALDDQLVPWPNFPTKATLVDFDPSSKASFEFLRHELSDCLATHPIVESQSRLLQPDSSG
jgi:hypothetical protein